MRSDILRGFRFFLVLLVTACGGDGGGGSSTVPDSRSARPAPDPPAAVLSTPSEPRNVTLRVVDHQEITVSWQSSLDNGGGTLTYVVRQYDGDSCISNERVVYQGGGLAYTVQKSYSEYRLLIHGNRE